MKPVNRECNSGTNGHSVTVLESSVAFNREKLMFGNTVHKPTHNKMPFLYGTLPNVPARRSPAKTAIPPAMRINIQPSRSPMIRSSPHHSSPFNHSIPSLVQRLTLCSRSGMTGCHAQSRVPVELPTHGRSKAESRPEEKLLSKNC